MIRTPSVATALIGGEAEHADRLLPDGWWRTSDLGHFDDEGRVYIVGRASETIITGGTNIQPVEIERALEAHASVREAVVVGVPDERVGRDACGVRARRPSSAPTGSRSCCRGSATGSPASSAPGTSTCHVEPIPRASGESKIARGDIKKHSAPWVADPRRCPST